ncbi:MAG: hypothetical protein HXY40_05320 [Chloroflexi bacterium]|nr:hypothetical protein [Chloroflexota bacterium]
MKQGIDQQYFAPPLPVSITTLPNADLDTQALRPVPESFGDVVTVYWIGTPMDFLKVLGPGESASAHLVISGHRDEEEGCYYLGEYVDFIDTSRDAWHKALEMVHRPQI